ncbi:ABC transporter permease subunit [Acidisoma cellulosilytica]|uniref:ABC transporter permease subunit n=1 Tax=Acidisoma cellulosilyticum TaxID=2802395 RepID=A0A963Z228_9PROT|nr:ABC transporter permease subunit [Acidisoma cellulosilyticum]MCB8881350.1 ABC transporter permease subunit [Acidisoma cellulosilyticum]
MSLTTMPVRDGGARRVTRALRFDPMAWLGILLLLLVWELAACLLPPAILPAPLGVVRRLCSEFLSAPDLSYFGLANASLLGSMTYTAENVLLAMIVGAAFAIPLGLVTARQELIRAVIDPVMMTVGTVPILILAPFLLIWFGVGRASAVLLVTFYVIVVVYVAAQRAAENIAPVFEDYAATLGASPRAVLRDILIPATIPEILGGLRIALAGAWGLEAVSELLGAQQGIGKIIEVLAGATDAQGIMAALLLLGLVATVCDGCAAWAIHRLTRWKSSTPVAGA